MWIIYNGISSDDVGVIVNSVTPVSVKPKRRETELVIPGRSGVLTIDDGSYDRIIQTVTMTLPIDRLTEVLQWLTGTGELLISPIPERKRKAKCSDVSEPKYWAAGLYQLTAQFSCDPYLYDASPASFTATDETIVLYNDGQETRPVIEMAAGSTVTINGVTFAAALKLTVDGENYIVYDGTTNRFASLTGELDDFVLTQGENTIVVTETVTIYPNWRWL